MRLYFEERIPTPAIINRSYCLALTRASTLQPVLQQIEHAGPAFFGTLCIISPPDIHIMVQRKHTAFPGWFDVNRHYTFITGFIIHSPGKNKACRSFYFEIGASMV